MIYKRGFLARPYDEFFSNQTRVAVLRVLSGQGVSMSGRAIARLAQVNHQAAANALEAFEQLGIARRSGEGRDTRWSFADRSAMAIELAALFRQEAGFARCVVAAVQKHLRKNSAGAILYGAVAKGRLEPRGTLHFAGVVGKAGRRALAADIRVCEAELLRVWSIRSQGKAVSSEEAGRLSLFETAWRVLPDEGPDWVSLWHGAR